MFTNVLQESLSLLGAAAQGPGIEMHGRVRASRVGDATTRAGHACDGAVSCERRGSVVEAHTGASEPTFTRLRHKIARDWRSWRMDSTEKKLATFGPVKVARDWRGLDEAP